MITDPSAPLIVDKYSSEQHAAHLVTVLVPCVRHGVRPYPGKSYARRPNGSLATVGFDMRGGTFDAHLAPVSGIDDLHRLLHAVAGKGAGLLVGGGLRDPDRRRGILRRVNGRDGRLPDLVRRPLPYLVLDLDKVPNILRLDPRTQPEEARAWMLSLLPASLRRARCVLRWSSSTCMDGDGPPETLGIHAWHWLDGILAPEEAKTLTICIDGHMRDALGLPTRGKRKRLADWKVCEAQQPVYVAPPRCGEGVADPFTTEQRIALVGGPDAKVMLDDLRAELGRRSVKEEATGPVKPPSARETRRHERGVPGRAATPPKPSLPRETLALPATPLLNRDHPLVLEIRAFTMQARREAVGKRAVDAALGAGRAAAELVRIALARVGWGREHGEFGTWAEAGGVPEGERDTWLYNVAACLAHALPGERILDGSLRDLVTRVGVALCGPGWTASGWVRERCDGSVMAKAVQAAGGGSVAWGGRRWDARYRWSAGALRRDLGIGTDEAGALGLLTLAEGAQEKRSRRVLKSLRRPGSVADERAADRAEVLQALASSHRRRDARRSRRRSSGERDAFWAGCEAELVRDPLEAARMADERLAAIQESWKGRVDRAECRADETRSDANRSAVVNKRMAGRSVIKAERRRYEALLGFRAAA